LNRKRPTSAVGFKVTGRFRQLGLAAATVLPGPIYRAMPESWHWPEKTAVNVLDRDMWDAGECNPIRIHFLYNI
jgi:hypothetical protein